MNHSILHRAIIRFCRNARLCLPALALALTLGTAVSTPPPTESQSVVVVPPIRTPLVNWNS